MHAVARYLGLSRPRRAWIFALVAGGACLACLATQSGAKAACGCVFLLGLAAASSVDLDRMIIPDFFSVGLALGGVTLSALVPALHGFGPFSLIGGLRSTGAAILGLGLGSALGLWIAILGELAADREVLGFGDVKLLGAIGAFCGWQGAAFAVAGGGLLAGAGAPPLLRLESAAGEPARLGWGVQFPFGPMLAAAAALYFLELHPWVDRQFAPYLLLF